MKQPSVNDAVKIPETSPHGVLVMQLGRHPNHFRGGFNDYNPTAHNKEELRLQMYAQAEVDTPNFKGHVQITLTPTEVKTFNAIEARIAERLGKEIVAKGK